MVNLGLSISGQVYIKEGTVWHTSVVGSTRGFLSNNEFETDGIGSILLLDSWNNGKRLLSMTNPTNIRKTSINNCASTYGVYNLNGIKSKTPRHGLINIIECKKIKITETTNANLSKMLTTKA